MKPLLVFAVVIGLHLIGQYLVQREFKRRAEGMTDEQLERAYLFADGTAMRIYRDEMMRRGERSALMTRSAL